MFFFKLAKNSITVFICMIRKIKEVIMKIQLITQNIKPMGLKTQTNSNPILKTNQADSFERQKVAFKGSNVPRVFKEKVLASIATKGKEGLGELFTDLPTTRQTLTVLKDLMVNSVESFDKISYGEISFATRAEAVNSMVQHHNSFSDALSFWNKLRETGSPLDPFLEKIYSTTENHKNLFLPLFDYADSLTSRGVVMEDTLRPFISVESWVEQFLP